MLRSHIAILLLATGTVSSSAGISVKSPDGDIRFTVVTGNGGSAPSYEVSYRGTGLVKNARLGLEFDDGELFRADRPGKPRRESGTECYDLPTGKCSHVEDAFNSLTIPFRCGARNVDLEIKAFNSGVGFRYVVRPDEPSDSCIILDENTTFDLAGDPQVLTMYLASYTTSHEGFYTRTPYSGIDEGRLMEMPTLVTYPSGVHMALTEAAVRGFAGMYLMKENGSLCARLSPHPHGGGVKVKTAGECRTPWRVFMIAPDAGSLIASNLLTSLNDPCAIADTSWITPAKTTFPWWNGNVVPDSEFLPGNNFATNRYYIDWCADNGIGLHNIYGYAEQPWYHDPDMSFEFPSPEADVTTPVRSLDMDAIGKYAAGKGVGLHLWVNWRPLYDRLHEALDKFRSWGVKGMMVDFMDRDDQEMIRIQEEILKAAADRHIFVQFHGSSKPSGLNRTYPNEFAREGTRNYECYKWSRDLSADFDIAIPFTRLLAGVTDYHLGGFRAVTPQEFTIRYTNPLVTNTRCHMLGMYVVLECYLGMVCDTPMAYEGQEGFDFIRQVPTVWDETTVPATEVMEYVCVARRKGDHWYVGAINNTTPRTITFRPDFLGEGTYEAVFYTDAPDSGTDPNKLEKRVAHCSPDETITLNLASGGGAAIHIYPAEPTAGVE